MFSEEQNLDWRAKLARLVRIVLYLASNSNSLAHLPSYLPSFTIPSFLSASAFSPSPPIWLNQHFSLYLLLQRNWRALGVFQNMKHVCFLQTNKQTRDLSGLVHILHKLNILYSRELNSFSKWYLAFSLFFDYFLLYLSLFQIVHRFGCTYLTNIS